MAAEFNRLRFVGEWQTSTHSSLGFMIQQTWVPLAKKSFNRSSMSERRLPGDRISTARSGAPGRNLRVDGVNPRARRRAFGMKEISGARQLRFCIQQPKLEPETAPNR